MKILILIMLIIVFSLSVISKDNKNIISIKIYYLTDNNEIFAGWDCKNFEKWVGKDLKYKNLHRIECNIILKYISKFKHLNIIDSICTADTQFKLLIIDKKKSIKDVLCVSYNSMCLNYREIPFDKNIYNYLNKISNKK